MHKNNTKQLTVTCDTRHIDHTSVILSLCTVTYYCIMYILYIYQMSQKEVLWNNQKYLKNSFSFFLFNLNFGIPFDFHSVDQKL